MCRGRVDNNDGAHGTSVGGLVALAGHLDRTGSRLKELLDRVVSRELDPASAAGTILEHDAVERAAEH